MLTPRPQSKSEDVYIWTHKRIDFGVNNDQIVDVNVTTANRVKLRKDITLHFTYQVRVCVCVCVCVSVWIFVLARVLACADLNAVSTLRAVCTRTR